MAITLHRRSPTRGSNAMMKKVVEGGPCGQVVIMDSITMVEPADAGAIVVCGSHGGASSGECALEVPLKLVVFNDAGGGKDDAGIVALTMLQASSVAGAAVAHTSARIGDSQDTWDGGVISQVNAAAQALGLTVGEPLRPALLRLIAP
jgi:hypothetical protein